MKVYSLIPQAMKEIGAIGKNGNNTHQNYKFRSIDDMYNKIQPVLASLGLFFVPTIVESHENIFESQGQNGKTTRTIRIKLKVNYKIFAEDGSSVETTVEGEALDTSDKATNKALTAAFKYMLIQVFCIAVEGQEDADSESIEVPSKSSALKTFEAKATKKDTSLESYKITFGKYKGKTIGEVDQFELSNYLEWVIKSANEKGKEITGAVKEFCEAAEELLIKSEKRKREELGEVIPF